MSRRIIRSDPGDEQTHLFAPSSVEPKKCSACQTTRRNLCRWAANRHFAGIDAPQPRSCLLRWNPETADIPY